MQPVSMLFNTINPSLAGFSTKAAVGRKAAEVVRPAFGDTNGHKDLPVVYADPQGRHLLHEIALVDEAHPNGLEDGILTVVPENVFGTPKHEVCKERGVIVQDIKNGKPRFVAAGYPGIYGYLPQTESLKAKGGDGDALDVLVIGLDKADIGKPFPVRVLGALDIYEVDENGNRERDVKIIALPITGGQNFSTIKTMEDLLEKEPGVVNIVTTWFKDYKKKDALVLEKYLNFDETMALVKENHEDWKPLGDAYQTKKATQPKFSAIA